MTSPPANSPDVLCAEILAEARRERDEILGRAGEAADNLHASALAEAEQVHRETVAAAHAEALRRQEMILATVEADVGRLQAARIEALLESIHAEVCRQLETQTDNRLETIAALAGEAIQQMVGADFVLRVSPADATAFGDRLTGEIQRKSDRGALRLMVIADAMVKNGVVVQSADGVQLWDNQLSSRLERQWPELRRQIAIQADLVGQNAPAGGDL